MINFIKIKHRKIKIVILIGKIVIIIKWIQVQIIIIMHKIH